MSIKRICVCGHEQSGHKDGRGECHQQLYKDDWCACEKFIYKFEVDQKQVKVVPIFLCGQYPGMAIIDEKGNMIKDFIATDYCCDVSMLKAIKVYMEENNYIWMFNELV